MREFILIDGPSGAGKTTYANQLAERNGYEVVHLDFFYPGWFGLEEGARMVVDTVLDPVAPGYRRWDWEFDRPGEWMGLNPQASYIIEGVGAITPESVAAARKLGKVTTILIDAPADVRRDRALERDPLYEPGWDLWAAQESAHFARLRGMPIDRRLSL